MHAAESVITEKSRRTVRFSSQGQCQCTMLFESSHRNYCWWRRTTDRDGEMFVTGENGMQTTL